MQTVMDIIAKTKKQLQNGSELSFDDKRFYSRQWHADQYNESVGDLKGYDCPICKNKGWVAVMVDPNAYEVMRECKCMDKRRYLQRIDKSGLRDLLNECTLEKFVVREEWQRRVKDFAEHFIADEQTTWLYIGGQVGCGKTHLCTAIVSYYLNAGKTARYMLWRDESVALKAVINDDEAYGNAIHELKTTDVLYIDDFFKTERGKQPTTADINLAFELLNYRYNNRQLVTIISSERSIDEIIDIDEAVGSRIYQRAGQYCIHVAHSREKNYRLRNRAHTA